MLRRFAAPPQLVFVSAYDSAAVDAFELRALDYLRKPVSRRRVEEALERVVDGGRGRRGPTRTATAGTPPSRRPADSEMVAVSDARAGSTRLIPRGSILYVQSHGDFVRIVTEDGRYLLRATLERDRAPLGAVRLRPGPPPVRRQPSARGRAPPAARRHRRARVRRRRSDPGGPPARDRAGKKARGQRRRALAGSRLQKLTRGSSARRPGDVDGTRSSGAIGRQPSARPPSARLGRRHDASSASCSSLILPSSCFITSGRAAS